MLAVFFTFTAHQVRAQYLQNEQILREPQPDQETLAFTDKYRCAVVKLLMKQFPEDTKPGAYSPLLTGTEATGFFINAAGDLITATHTFFLHLPPPAGFVETQRIINFDGTDSDFVRPTPAEIEDGRLSDVLIIRTNRKPPCFLKLRSSKTLKVGQALFSIGFPKTHDEGYIFNGAHHQRPLVQRGYFIESVVGRYGPQLRVNLYSVPGSSGSPILASDGAVVGVLVQGLPSGVYGTPIEESPGLNLRGDKALR